MTERETTMRRLPLLAILLLAGCSSNDGTTRNFALVRDAPPQSVTAARMPLWAPPSLADRPTRAGALVPGRNAPATDQVVGSQGQDALVQAAGPSAAPDIRATINEQSGLVYADPGFVDRLMNWAPPPGYTPVITQGSSGGWFSRVF
jgi:Protein of unknown function (DUF3035)